MTTASIPFASHPVALKPIKPMRMTESLFLFGIPAALLAFSVLWVWPALTAAGFSNIYGYAICLTVVNAGLIVAALVGYVREGQPLTWAAFAQRMRFTRMSGRTWVWAIVSTFVFAAAALLINSLAMMIYDAIGFTIPDIAMGIKLPVWLSVIVLLFNIFGEELWWRGYILPRQELSYGKTTWLIHGILWACFHMFKWYAVPFMLITCQIIPFVAQRTKNTWPGIINHMIINGASTVMTYL